MKAPLLDRSTEYKVDFFDDRDHNNIFLETSKEQDERVRKNSPFSNLKTWRLLKVIVKSNDDVRQEQFAMQLIRIPWVPADSWAGLITEVHPAATAGARPVSRSTSTPAALSYSTRHCGYQRRISKPLCASTSGGCVTACARCRNLSM